MLEVGSFYGGSLQIWREYLHPDSVIVSIDTNSKLMKIANAGGVRVRFDGGQKTSLLKQIAAEFAPFDVIIDSGSHTSSHMVDSFRALFTSALADGGVYIVEDVACDYWKQYRDSRVSFSDLVKALIDAMHAHYQVTRDETNFRDGDPDRSREVAVPAITPMLGKIEIYDSLVVIHRSSRRLPRSIHRS